MQNSLVMAGAQGIPRTWEALFSLALRAIGEIARHGRDDPFWTFGGGTVLMLRYGHRFSKDIDIFVPDPQSLGFVTPRLSEVAESITTDYVEAAGYVKLYLPEGEIDFVAAPNLTMPGFEIETILGHQVRVETSAEIIANQNECNGAGARDVGRHAGDPGGERIPVPRAGQYYSEPFHDRIALCQFDHAVLIFTPELLNRSEIGSIPATVKGSVVGEPP